MRHPPPCTRYEVGKVEDNGPAEKEEQSGHPKISNIGKCPCRDVTVTLFERTDQKHCKDHQHHERSKRDSRCWTECQRTTRSHERINMRSAVDHKNKKNEKSHLPKLTPIP